MAIELDMHAITTTSERTGHWIKMRRSLVWFSRPESLIHTRSLAGFITITSGFRFSVHTATSSSSRPARLRRRKESSETKGGENRNHAQDGMAVARKSPDFLDLSK